MKKEFLCSNCKKGPCTVDQTAVRPVLIDYYRSYYPTSDMWKHYDFTRVHQCMDVINSRKDIFWCDHCGFMLEDHMLHTLVEEDSELQLCPDCYRSMTEDTKR